MFKVANSYNILTASVAKRSFKQSAYVLNGNGKGSDEWNDFIGSLSNTKKTAAVYNKPKNPTRNFNKNRPNKDFKGKQSRDFKNKRTTSRKPSTQEGSAEKSEKSVQGMKPAGNVTSRSPKKEDIGVDLSIFDSEPISESNSTNKKTSYKEKSLPRNGKQYQRRAVKNTETEFDPEKVIRGHTYGVKEYRVDSKQEETTRRLSYKAIKNDDKVVLGTAMKFFKSHSNYSQPEIFINPNMLFNTSRECMLNVPRMINSKEHALRDAGFDVYKKLANEHKFKNEKISQILKVQEWEELPEGFNLNDPSWDFIERKHMIHSSMNRGSTYQHVHQSATNALASDSSLKIDVERLDSLLNSEYDQDYLGELGLTQLSDFQTKFKGIYAPNVIDKLYQSSSMLRTALNNSPAFSANPERKQELFEYMSLLKPTNRILEKKKAVLAGHRPGKANA